MRNELSVSRDLREVGILRIAWSLQAGYEWSHHYEFAAASGVPAAVLLAVKAGAAADSFTPPYDLAVCLADEIAESTTVSDACYDALSRAFPPAQVVEMMTTFAFYTAVARLTKGLRLPLERGRSWEPLPARSS